MKVAAEKAEQERDEAKKEIGEMKVAAEKAEEKIASMNVILEKAKSNADDKGCVTLNKDTFDKILAITTKF